MKYEWGANFTKRNLFESEKFSWVGDKGSLIRMILVENWNIANELTKLGLAA